MPNTQSHKTCRLCNLSKELSEFYFRKDLQKRRNECKQCLDKQVREYRKTARGQESRRREALKYFKTERGKATHKKCLQKYQAWYPERIKAMSAVAWAIKTGKLIRPKFCQRCNAEKARIEAHHHKGYDLEHMLDVQWLCALCHRAVDSQ